MSKGRLEAFSDGVIAIIITIMVLELKIPQGATLDALGPLASVFLSYALSYVFIGIYWNNHHHMLQAAGKVNGRVLWANLHLLFWLSLIPFVTGWMGQTFGKTTGENHFAATPVALYGVVLLMASIAYYILARSLASLHGRGSKIAIALGRDIKGLSSTAIYVLAIPLSFVNPWIAFSAYVLVAVIWFIPDRRMEKAVAQ